MPLDVRASSTTPTNRATYLKNRRLRTPRAAGSGRSWPDWNDDALAPPRRRASRPLERIVVRVVRISSFGAPTLRGHHSTIIVNGGRPHGRRLGGLRVIS